MITIERVTPVKGDHGKFQTKKTSQGLYKRVLWNVYVAQDQRNQERSEANSTGTRCGIEGVRV